MNTSRLTNILLDSLLLSLISVSVMAGPPEGKGPGGGEKDDSTSSGGNGFNTPNPISLTIEFGNGGSDSVKSDIYGAYVDEPRDPENPDYRMDAHVDGDGGGSYGNLFLLIQDSSRSVLVDLASGCVDGCDVLDESGAVVEQNQPFRAREFSSLGLTVSATESIAGGLCGMEPGTPPITAPMQIIYDDVGTFETEAPGFIDFFPASKRKSPCYGHTSEVSVYRVNDTSWQISGNLAACVTWPGGRVYGGISVMPFELTANINSDSELFCE